MGCLYSLGCCGTDKTTDKSASPANLPSPYTFSYCEGFGQAGVRILRSAGAFILVLLLCLRKSFIKTSIFFPGEKVEKKSKTSGEGYLYSLECCGTDKTTDKSASPANLPSPYTFSYFEGFGHAGARILRSAGAFILVLLLCLRKSFIKTSIFFPGERVEKKPKKRDTGYLYSLRCYGTDKTTDKSASPAMCHCIT